MNILKYTRIIKRGALCCGLLFTFLPCGFAAQGLGEEESDKPMMLYFRFDKALLDSGYMDNGNTLRHLDELLTDRHLCTRIDSINVFSFASPEGNCIYNNRLARQRSAAVKSYLAWKYPHLDRYRIHPRPQGENWQELRRLIVNDPNMPDKEKVLQIIEHTQDSERCKALLKKLNGGVPYHYIYRHLLRYLRNAAVCMVWIRPDSLPILPKAIGPHPDSLKAKPVARLSAIGTSEGGTNALYPQGNLATAAASYRRPLFALKTNLLFDAALMPNIEIEVPIGNRWSVNGEYMFPWWLFDNDKYCMQILMGGLEGRYWLGSHRKREQKEVLTGHFLGLYAGGGKYDLQWDNDGYQGEFFIAAGISYGWATRIARNLRLEFNIGIGLLRTDYRYYHARDNYQTLLWQENGRYTWFGPTKAKISFVWLLNRKVKKGGAR
ncbi:DUF3575 domain-containing protein [uncultured Bacteroides sp.]|uniref:DUF3575 domain-containing protein n=2 Tax=uncultured Bacteroides sp. TaxID=162156 RepID=UPI0025DB2ECD|nr:DUF3575 domain-containing protein [uncultured Bacteroides sp.]